MHVRFSRFSPENGRSGSDHFGRAEAFRANLPGQLAGIAPRPPRTPDSHCIELSSPLPPVPKRRDLTSHYLTEHFRDRGYCVPRNPWPPAPFAVGLAGGKGEAVERSTQA